MSTFVWIVLANFISRLCALSIAGLLSIWFLLRFAREVSLLACGMLFAVALTHLIPEALEAGASVVPAVLTLAFSFVGFVAFDRCLASRFGHLHATQNIVHPIAALLGGGVEVRTVSCPGHTGGSLSILVGAACHNFVDGVLVAAAFMTGLAAGLTVCGAILAHEVPQLIGQMAILRRLGMRLKVVCAALFAVSLMAVVGGAAGASLFEASQALVPYAMLVSAAGFTFVALVLAREEFFTRKREDYKKSVAIALVGAALSALVLSCGH